MIVIADTAPATWTYDGLRLEVLYAGCKERHHDCP